MHPDSMIAMARTYQHEARRQAEVGRRAAEFKTPKHRRVEARLPRLALGRRPAAAPPRPAHV